MMIFADTAAIQPSQAAYIQNLALISPNLSSVMIGPLI